MILRREKVQDSPTNHFFADIWFLSGDSVGRTQVARKNRAKNKKKNLAGNNFDRERNPLKRKFLYTFRTSSHEDFALASKLQLANFRYTA